MVSNKMEEQVLKAEEEVPSIPSQSSEPSHTYELLLIISPTLGDEEADARLEKISAMITEKGGTIESVNKWGKRKLAYPIKQCTDGNYVLVNFSFDPMFCRQLEASLRISEDILRHLLINVELS